MILDNQRNFKQYEAIHQGMRAAYDFIQRQDLETLEVGKHVIDGDNVFAMIQNYDTKSVDEGDWEAHKKYLDIQYMIDGTEAIKVANIEKMEVKQPYNNKDDYWLFTGEGDTITLQTGMFAIFFPEDVHKPGIQINQEAAPVKKAVIKILLG
ncbi:YhcH/YjgK/YiaL family protein [Neobacillus mesonae]|uniref:YhcH/YjgK/YiaL family protein n=1 Tax=Neobacillus mesonae TaxID=1193713 RepID=UPI00203BBFE9|nr:YhcH/YjgK/YiaL family protein [Neobacillus mesonae]MCM3570902.1 YhcH/YjgK/YiaL family protein [Neobacillus mesonae]